MVAANTSVLGLLYRFAKSQGDDHGSAHAMQAKDDNIDAPRELIERLTLAFLKPYWRIVRGQTIQVRAIVLDEKNGVLLVRHSYRPGWDFPGGGVERQDTL